MNTSNQESSDNFAPQNAQSSSFGEYYAAFAAKMRVGLADKNFVQEGTKLMRIFLKEIGYTETLRWFA